MERVSADLAALQSNIKRDPDGYVEDFEMQLRRYSACLDIFALQPTRPHRELGELAAFLAAVAPSYPNSRAARALPRDLAGLLSSAAAPSMDPPLRLALAKSLMLLRNRGAIAAEELLPLWVGCLRLRDKALRRLVCSHVVADVKRSNAKRRDDRLNRATQAALGASAASDESSAAARASLGLLAELWRRRLWRDTRTANAIAGGCSHADERLAVSALKFFLGEDAAEAAAGDESSDDDDDGDGDGKGSKATLPFAGPGKGDIYRATQLGTTSSKKKKQAKLKRAMASVKRAVKRERSATAEGFAALQLLHDPQTFAERLFARIRGGGSGKNATEDAASGAPSAAAARPFARHDARLAGARVLSRAIGTHRLILLNFYPWVQRQLAPHHRDVSLLLSALVQASHDRVPPEALHPALRQLVDAFVHDRARPEVAVAGLKAVRELCSRAPLVMEPDLLSDLAAYRKSRDKEVASAARALVSLFRDINPALLAKRERGRGADLEAAPAAFGAADVATRVPGADLLEAEEEKKRRRRRRGGGGESDEEEDEEEEDWSAEEGEESSEEEEEEEEVDDEGSGEDGEEASGGDESDKGSEEEEDRSEDEDGDGDDAAPLTPPPAKKRAVAPSASAPLKPAADSLATLKRALAEAKAKKAAAAAAVAADAQEEEEGAKEEADDAGDGDKSAAAPSSTATTSSSFPLEAGRFLDDGDFRRIRELRRERLVEGALAKHGLKSASKRARAEADAGADADAALAAAAARSAAPERRVDPDSLLCRARGKRDKAARMASVLEGREGRDFGSAAGRRKAKAGGLSNREKQKRKAMPLAARSAQARKRAGMGRSKRPGKAGKGKFKR